MDSRYQQLLNAYKTAGGDLEILKDVDIAHLMVHGNEVCSSRVIPGLHMEAKQKPEGVDLDFVMKSSFKYENPINICFGLIPKRGIQRINLTGKVEDNAGVKILAYCIFPNAVDITHIMAANVKVGDNSFFDYRENH
ncbi:MAG: SufBD protein, partial [Candidatus Omnitrophica bacterium]|nr:SufBD protein [Candidatus Omnitrophota bacterium]